MSAEDDVNAEPRRPESTAVVLARMEGKLDLANERLTNQAERVGTLETRVTDHDAALEKVRLDLQQIRSDQALHIAAEAAAVAAVKAAKDEEVREAERRWSPQARFWTAASSIAFVISAIAAIAQYLATHH